MNKLELNDIFKNFLEISKVPRGSYNTKGIADYLENMAKELKLEYSRDEHDNVIIYKNASSGYENSNTVILQAHTDMVCASDIPFDFINKPIDVVVDNDCIYAKNTSLGADNGIGVAMIINILKGNYEHPPLECVFTSNEEVGLLGAVNLDATKIKGRLMINIDSEEEGIFTVGCAGGASYDIKYPVKTEKRRGTLYRLDIGGLNGGHSGIMINCGYANAIRLMGELLKRIQNSGPIKIVNFEGGVRDNVIPDSCYCEFVSDGRLSDVAIKKNADKFISDIKANYNEENIFINVSTIESDEARAVTEKNSCDFIKLLTELPNYVQAMDKHICNIGTIRMGDDCIQMTGSVRSSKLKSKSELCKKITDVVSNHEGTVELSGEYPAWEYNEKSVLRDIAIDVFKKMYNKEPKCEIIHAGLECGVFADKIDGFDGISIGPNLKDIHTSDEKLDIPSSLRVYNYILELIKNLK